MLIDLWIANFSFEVKIYYKSTHRLWKNDANVALSNKCLYSSFYRCRKLAAANEAIQVLAGSWAATSGREREV